VSQSQPADEQLRHEMGAPTPKPRRRIREAPPIRVAGTELGRDKITDYVGRSQMLVTALSAHIGYDKACAIAHKTDYDSTTCTRQPLRWACGRQTLRASLTRGRWPGSPGATAASKTVLSRGI
jgi:hypothetical protein